MVEYTRGYARNESDERRLLKVGLTRHQIYREDRGVEQFGNWRMRAGETLAVVDGFRSLGATQFAILKKVKAMHDAGVVIVDAESSKRSDRNSAEMLLDALSKWAGERRIGDRAKEMQEKSVKARTKGRTEERRAAALWNDGSYTVQEVVAALHGWSQGSLYRTFGKRRLPPGRRDRDFERPVPAPKARPKRGKRGHIYFIMAGARGPIKIGFSLKSASRMNALQISHHRKLRVIAAMHGTQKTEKELHQRFEKLRVRGEWFRYGGDLKKFVEMLPKLDDSE